MALREFEAFFYVNNSKKKDPLLFNLEYKEITALIFILHT